MPERIFVDTSAWVAVGSVDDERHARAKAEWDRLITEQAQLVTSNYVISETITTVQGFAGHARAVELGEQLFNSQSLRRVRVDEALERTAWLLFKKYDDQEFSFIDCSSFAVMKAQGMKKAFAFDRDFRIAGFQLLP